MNIGIDLGTTNSALAYVAEVSGSPDYPEIKVLEIPQYVAPGQIEPRRTLPSFLFLGDQTYVGAYAREQGALVPTKSVHSAKSWLSNPDVDRTAKILPWDAQEGGRVLSPVEVSNAIISHIRDAWNQAHPNEPLAGQDLVLTVPACVLLATLAGPLIRAIYGQRWVPAAHALSLLAVLGLMRVAYGLFYDGMAVTGRRNGLMGIQGLWLAALIPVLIIGARLRGITGVSAGHVVVAAVLVGPAFLWALSRAGIRVRSMMAACLRPAIGGALMATVSLIVIRVAGSGVPGLAAAIVAGCAVYLPVVYPMRTLLRRSPALGELDEASAA